MCKKHSWVEWMITSQMYKTEFLSMTNRQITIHLRVLDRGRKLQFPTYSGISFMSLTLIALGVSTRTIKRHIKEMDNVCYVGRGFIKNNMYVMIASPSELAIDAYGDFI